MPPVLQRVKASFPQWVLFSFLLAGSLTAKASHTNVHTVFLIVMENVTWSELKGSSDAPFLNTILLPMSAYADNFFTGPGTSGSLPQYLWLEAGTNFGITDSADPSAHHLATTNHLVIQLQNAGISWKAYEEGVTGAACPIATSGLYAAFHNPFVYFDDVYLNSLNCSNHIRPYAELAVDLTNNTAPRYCFITPNLCDDMHNSSGCTTPDRIRNGDTWLASEVSKILASAAYQNNGALFVTWDEGTGGASGPFATLVLSAWARGGGYRNTNRFDHASTLRTIQEIFGVRPLLNEAATAPGLSDLFKPDLWLRASHYTNAAFAFTVTGASPGKTNIVQASTNLLSWLNLITNVSTTNTFDFTDAVASNSAAKYYRAIEW